MKPTIKHLIDSLFGIAMVMAVGWFAFAGDDDSPVASPAKWVSVDVAPQGWRRTVNGWERAEDWARKIAAPSESIDYWITRQRAQESSAASRFLRRLSRVHPLVISSSLLLCVIAIVIRNDHQRKAIDEDLPSAD